MLHNFCTLFNSNYLSRGVALYESLIANNTDFHLYIFAFDSLSYRILTDMNLDRATIISLEEFESEELLTIKKERTAAEYCWTCTPSTISYCIDQYKLDQCTYLDADIFFFADPSPLLDENKNYSTLITDHRYTPKYDASASSGKYCVQFISFKNTEHGMEALEWWRKACNEWCYARCEDGKFGDQKYLDDWTERFKEVHVLEHLGGGVAPWNIQQYQFNDNLNGTEIKTDHNFNLIFYHFHNIKFREEEQIYLSEYEITPSQIKSVYKPYVTKLLQIADDLKKSGETNDFHSTVYLEYKEPVKNIRWFFRTLEKLVKGKPLSSAPDKTNLFTIKHIVENHG